MESIDYELKILELEDRNRFLEAEYKWVWELYKDIRKQFWYATEAKKKELSGREK